MLTKKPITDQVSQKETIPTDSLFFSFKNVVNIEHVFVFMINELISTIYNMLLSMKSIINLKTYYSTVQCLGKESHFLSYTREPALELLQIVQNRELIKQINVKM